MSSSDAAIIAEQVPGMLGAAARGLAVDDSGWVAAAPWPIISPAEIEHRHTGTTISSAKIRA